MHFTKIALLGLSVILPLAAGAPMRGVPLSEVLASGEARSEVTSLVKDDTTKELGNTDCKLKEYCEDRNSTGNLDEDGHFDPREQQTEEGSESLEERKEKPCKWYYYLGFPCR